MKNIYGHGASALAGSINGQYKKGSTDYYMPPVVLTGNDQLPLGRIQNVDSVIFCCRRGEREIELTEAFTETDFPHFPRTYMDDLDFVIMTLYHEKFKDLPVAFAPSSFDGTLAEAVSRAGLRQLHLAESEKYAHVTFFLNGGNNLPFQGETDISIPSQKNIPFDQVPELSLPEVADSVIEGINNNIDLIAVNFANGDVIGHTSNNEAKIKCAEAVDRSLGRVIEKAKEAEYVTIVTADHGNLEELFTDKGSPHAAHTANPVPFIIIDPLASSGEMDIKDGRLADIAPTVLSVMGIKPSSQMEGDNLVYNHEWKEPRKVVLIILDGWGFGEDSNSNPIFIAETPEWDNLLKGYPGSRLKASGEFVGLQPGKPGNSEAGHLNIGAGRVIPQDDVRLDNALKDGSFFSNEVFLKTIQRVKDKGSNLHLLGLLTEKSSHGSIRYPLSLLRMAKDNNLDNVFLHLILDGRSTQNGSAPAMLEELEEKIKEIGIGCVVSCIGRGIALDRDGNYEKIRQTYDLLVSGKGEPCEI